MPRRHTLTCVSCGHVTTFSGDQVKLASGVSIDTIEWWIVVRREFCADCFRTVTSVEDMNARRQHNGKPPTDPDELVREILRIQQARNPDGDPGDMMIDIQDDSAATMIAQNGGIVAVGGSIRDALTNMYHGLQS